MLLIMSSLGYLLVCDLSIKAQTVACPWRNPPHAWLIAVRSPSRYTANHQASAHRGSSNPWKGHLHGWWESECSGFRSWWPQVRGKREKIGNVTELKFGCSLLLSNNQEASVSRKERYFIQKSGQSGEKVDSCPETNTKDSARPWQLLKG